MVNVTIRDIYPTKPLLGHVGIEIEVEAKGQLPNVNNNWWSTKPDQSLRGGFEYVNKMPMPDDEKKLGRIKKVTDALEAPGVEVIKDSHRTSVHVHNNIQDFTPVEVWTATTAYWLVETLIFEWFGEERKGNLFCLRLKDAEYVLRRVVMDIEHPREAFQHVSGNNVKYGGLNLNAISRFGSLETRGMAGIVDPNIIDEWSSTCYRLFNKARLNFKSPEALLDYYYHNGKDKTLDLLLPKGKLLEFLKGVRKGENMMDDNACRLTRIAFAADWDDYQKEINKVYRKRTPEDKQQAMLDRINGNNADWIGLDDIMPARIEPDFWAPAQDPRPIARVKKKIVQPNLHFGNDGAW